MSITKIMRNALNTKWSMTDDFEFLFSNKFRPLLNSDNSSGVSVQDIFDMSVINIDLPQLGSDVETTMIGGEWRIHNTKFQPFTFQVTFRDFGSLDLRNYFSKVWMDAQRGYFNDVKSHIKISIQRNIVFESRDCLITSVSQVQLSNNESQVVEFTVEFSSPYYSNQSIKDFGSDKHREIDSNKKGDLKTEGKKLVSVLQTVIKH